MHALHGGLKQSKYEPFACLPAQLIYLFSTTWVCVSLSRNTTSSGWKKIIRFIMIKQLLFGMKWLFEHQYL